MPGKSIVLGFRYVSDGGVNDGGWYVDDVKVGGTLVNDGTTTGRSSRRHRLRPVPVHNLTVRVVGLDAGAGKAVVRTFGARSFSLTAAQLARFADLPAGRRDRRPTTSRPSSTSRRRCTA